MRGYGHGMTTSPEPAPAIVEPAPRPKRRLKIVLIVIGVLLALIIAIGVGAFLLVNESTKDAQKISDQLVTAVQNGDGAAAYALTGPSFRAATNEAQLSELVTNLSSLVTKDKSSANSKSISVSTDNGKIAVFLYTMKGTSGKPIYFKTQIREEDGRWQVMSFRSSESKLTNDIE
jgi:flagellar basal body-associated protein FliL